MEIAENCACHWAGKLCYWPKIVFQCTVLLSKLRRRRKYRRRSRKMLLSAGGSSLARLAGNCESAAFQNNRNRDFKSIVIKKRSARQANSRRCAQGSRNRHQHVSHPAPILWTQHPSMNLLSFATHNWYHLRTPAGAETPTSRMYSVLSGTPCDPHYSVWRASLLSGLRRVFRELWFPEGKVL